MPLERGVRFSIGVFFFSIPRSYGFDILKTNGENLKIVVCGVDVGVEWDKTFLK